MKNKASFIIYPLIVIIGFSICIGVLFFLNNLEYKRCVTNFEQDYYNRVTVIKKNLDLIVFSMKSIKSFYTGSQEVTREEFNNFVDHFFIEINGIQAIKWIPKISHSKKDIFIKNARLNGFTDFNILEKGDNDNLINAKKRKYYLPIHYSVSIKDKEKMFGFDFASDTDYFKELNRAIKDENVIILEEQAFSKENKDKMMFFLPIYNTDASLKGFILVIIDLENLIDGTIKHFLVKNIDTVLVDRYALVKKMYYYHKSRIGESANVNIADVLDNNISVLHRSLDFEIANKKWSLICIAGQKYIKNQKTMIPIIVFFVSVASFVLIIILFYLFKKLTENNKIKKLVAIKTSQLKKSKKHIENSLNQQKLISTILQLFNVSDNFNETVKIVLKKIGEHTGVSRVYVFENIEDDTAVKNTFEWCNKNIEPQIDNLQNISYDKIPSWKPLLVNEGKIFSRNIFDLPQDIVDILKSQNIKSILIIPLYVRGLFYGFIGFDECVKKKTWIFEDFKLLQTISNLVSNAIEKKLVYSELLENEERLQLAISSADLGLWDWNMKTGDVYFNNTWAEMLGYKLDEIEPNVESWSKLLNPKDKKAVNDVLDKHLDGKIPVYKTEYRLKTKSGKWKWILDMGKVFERDKTGKALRAIGVHLDIDSSKKYQKKLQEIAITDPLTKLYNRKYFFERFSKELEKFKRKIVHNISIVILDIDYFKTINDNYGHQAGDYVLTTFSQLLKKSVRKYDLIGRYGGEEFIILFIEIDKEKALDVCVKIRNALLHKKMTYQNKKINFTFSAGIADLRDYKGKNKIQHKLLKIADDRLYEAKRKGRDLIIKD